MKNLLLILFVIALTLNVIAQTPVAVNDTFYVYLDTPKIINRSDVVGNDTATGLAIVDTVLYSGPNQVDNISWNSTLNVTSFKFTPQGGYFGLDSITYVLQPLGVEIFDTAMVYIYVKRKAYENLDINNIRANINNVSLFQQHEMAPAIAGFNVPKQNNVSDPYYASIYAANLWISGEDNNGMVKTFAPMFGQDDANNASPIPHTSAGDAGPIGVTDFYSYKWDRVWKVSQTEIDYHIANYTSGGYQPIEVIENWPAHGDINLGQAQNLAPFVDVNNDGIYNPLNGDYPKIKGQQAVYFIKNDERIPHTYTGTAIGAEVHGMAYAYDCSSDSALNHTIFLNYKIYNRSAFTLTNAYAGFWTDTDIGNFGDDFIGCDIPRGAYYGYNGDNDDEDQGADGYGTHIPAQGVVFLKGPKKEDDFIDNPLTTNIQDAIDSTGIPYAGLGVGYGDGIVDNEYFGMKKFFYYSSSGGGPGDGDPTGAEDFYNYLQGNWKGATGSMVWGGDGNPLSTGIGGGASYMFPGDSDPLFWGTNGVVQTPLVWSEVTENNNPADRRGLGSAGPFEMQPGAMVELDLAFVFGRDYQNTGNTAGIVVMQERIDSIRSYYLNDFQSVCGGVLAGVDNIEKGDNKLQVYPNPFYNQFMVNYELKNRSAQLKVFNIFGELVSHKQITKATNKIDLADYANGIYVVQITDGATTLTKKLVKQ